LVIGEPLLFDKVGHHEADRSGDSRETVDHDVGDFEGRFDELDAFWEVLGDVESLGVLTRHVEVEGNLVGGMGYLNSLGGGQDGFDSEFYM
jgi:hypothetical protein